MQAVTELPPGFLGQFEGGEEGLDYFLAKQVRRQLGDDCLDCVFGQFVGHQSQACLGGNRLSGLEAARLGLAGGGGACWAAWRCPCKLQPPVCQNSFHAPLPSRAGAGKAV